VWVVVFPVAMTVIALTGVVPLGGDPGWGIRLLLSAFAVLLGWRLFRLAAIGTTDGRLLVRNHWHDQAVRREDITEASVVYVRGGSLGKVVELALRDGSTLRLGVTEVPFGTHRVERQAAEVREWLSGRPQPFL
jgi:hypothetical protein